MKAIVDSIPLDQLSHAARRSGAHARALLYFELFMRGRRGSKEIGEPFLIDVLDEDIDALGRIVQVFFFFFFFFLNLF